MGTQKAHWRLALGRLVRLRRGLEIGALPTVCHHRRAGLGRGDEQQSEQDGGRDDPHNLDCSGLSRLLQLPMVHG
jgi:hypothetical protein